MSEHLPAAGAPQATGVRDVSLALRRSGLHWIAIGLLWSGLFWSVQPLWFPTREQVQRQTLARLLLLRKPQIAAELPESLLAQAPVDPWVLAAAGEAAASRSDDEAAIRFFQQLPRDGHRWEFIAERGLAKRAMIRGRFLDAERHLRRALELHPNHIDTLEQLGHLLQIEGRTWEAAPYFWAQVLRGRPSGDQLLAAAATDRFFRKDDQLELNALGRTPPEPLMQLGVARSLSTTETQRAEELLRVTGECVPDCGEAQGRLGRLIVDRGDLREFLQWRGGLSDAVAGIRKSGSRKACRPARATRSAARPDAFWKSSNSAHSTWRTRATGCVPATTRTRRRSGGVSCPR